MILVTGGAGFIGSNFVLDWLENHDEHVLTLDALTYAGNLANLESLESDPRHAFQKGDIGDGPLVDRLLATHRPRAIVNFAAESHVDRSIHGPAAFLKTNIEGTFNLLESARAHHATLAGEDKAAFRFLHVSTDEVYGSLAPDAPPFTEDHPYEPNSPYSASKAASDHLVRAWHHTYGLPTLTTNCSNNYGPLHFPEKLIPLVIVNALAGKPLPVYGDGLNVRDWLFVTDHCSAIRTVLAHGRVGETYNVGGLNEKTNIEIVRAICALLDELRPDPAGLRERLITFVKDRPGHDRRYAIDATKLETELGRRPAETFETGLRKTVQWYLANGDWVQGVQSGAYRDWISAHYTGQARRMKILLFGCGGQVGWELQRSLQPLGEVVALDFDSRDFCADFTQPDALAATVAAVRPDVIVNAAAHTAVDKAESEPALAQAINADSVGVVARAAADSGAWLVHFGTDYVFDGSGDQPRDEEAPTAPLSVYGRTKLAGEERIRASGCRHLILRTSWVYAARGGNFAKTMLRLAGERTSLNVIDDQVGAPTGAELLADLAAHMIRAARAEPGLAGTYNAVASGATSWHGYARLVIETARARGMPLALPPGALAAIPTSAYPTPAPRPLNSRLDTRKLRERFGLDLPNWESGVLRMLDEILPTPQGVRA